VFEVKLPQIVKQEFFWYWAGRCKLSINYSVVEHVMVQQDTRGDKEFNHFRIRVGLDYFKQESRNQLEIELEFK
jgi:hypothetical protein